MEDIIVTDSATNELRKVFATEADTYLDKASPADKALAYLTLHFSDIAKTRVVAMGVSVDVPNIFCDVFKSNIHGDLYDDEVENYAEVEYEEDITKIKTEPEMTGFIVGESIIDEFKVKRYGSLS